MIAFDHLWSYFIIFYHQHHCSFKFPVHLCTAYRALSGAVARWPWARGDGWKGSSWKTWRHGMQAGRIDSPGLSRSSNFHWLPWLRTAKICKACTFSTFQHDFVLHRLSYSSTLSITIFDDIWHMVNRYLKSSGYMASKFRDLMILMPYKSYSYTILSDTPICIHICPICSMYGIFTYIWAIFGLNVGIFW